MNALKMPRRLLLAGLAACGFSACSPSPEANSTDGKPVVVTTTTMVTDIVRSIAGDDVIVQPLMGPTVDPHLWKPGQEDIQHLQKADVIFYSGLHLEGKMADILERLQSQGRKVYALSDALSESDIIRADDQPDPHIWGDASQWAKGARFAGKN